MRSVSFILLALLVVARDTRADDLYGNQDGYNDDADGDMDASEYQQGYYNNGNQQNSGEYIQYWTEYAILPKRCIR
jgi:hypothetical protein